MSEKISVDFIKNKIDEKVLVQYGCSVCGNIFNSEREYNEHIANCVQNTLNARDPLEIVPNKALKRKLKSKGTGKRDPNSLFENSQTSEELSDNEYECKKVNKSDISVKQEQDNILLENPVYEVTSQMLSDNEMLITLPYDQGDEFTEVPVDVSHEVAIDYEEHTEENDIRLEYKPHIYEENEVESNPNEAVIINYDDKNSNNFQQENVVKILSIVTAKPPGKKLELNTGSSNNSMKDTVAIINNVEDSENAENDVKLLTVLNSVDINQLDTQDEQAVMVIDMPSPTENGEKESSYEFEREIQFESDPDDGVLEKSEVENTQPASREAEEALPLQSNKTTSNNVSSKDSQVKVHLPKERLRTGTIKEKLTQNLETEQDKEDKFKYKNKKHPQENRNRQTPKNLQDLEESQNKKEQLKRVTYIEIFKTEKKDPEKPAKFEVYDFFDEEEEKLKEKIKSDLEKERAIKARTCKFCNKLFDDPMDVLRHKRQFHSFKKISMTKEQLEPYFNLENQKECPLCFKWLSKHGYKSVYLKHLMTHCDEYNFVCRVCEMQFRRKDHWLNHESRHVVRPESVQND